jgi:16S rRNA (cytosine967-C5)-methyltransferase
MSDETPISSEDLSGASSDGLAARASALILVQSAQDHRGGLEEAMDRAPFSDLELRDRALARMMAMTLLRRLGAIDAMLQTKLAKPPPMAVMMLLRLGVVQALFMDTPAFAAVDTTVRLAERDENTRPFKGLINAVLRGLLRERPPEAEAEANAPGWLFARWRAAFGEAAAQAIATMIVEEPSTDLTLKDPAEAAALSQSIGAVELPGGSLRVGHRGDVTAWPGYVEGRWWVQDAAAAMPARIADLRPDETGIDLCAAPGGKLLQLARTGGAVVGLDRSGPRLRRVRSALERTGLSAEVVQADAGSWSDPRQFNVVLLDAPCSATGTFRRHPDVLWATRPPDIAKLAGVQTRLLDAAAKRVLPGGRLIYCVCSLEPEEGEQQVDAFLKRHADFRLSTITAGEGGAPEASVTEAGWLRILPHHLEGGMDGFFVARLVRGHE